MKDSTLKLKEAVPGNVFHERKKFMDEGKGVSSNSLNPKKVAELSGAEIKELKELQEIER
jgi:hypothetical protein